MNSILSLKINIVRGKYHSALYVGEVLKLTTDKIMAVTDTLDALNLMYVTDRISNAQSDNGEWDYPMDFSKLQPLLIPS